MEGFWDKILYAKTDDVNFGIMSIRTVMVFCLSMVAVRVGDTRFFGKSSVLDIILALIWGSLVSRAITGNAPFLDTVGTAMLFVFMHWAMAYLSLRYPKIGFIVKGKETQLVKDGKYIPKEMRKLNISHKDILEWVRLRTHLTTIEEIEAVYAERNGDLSIIPKKINSLTPEATKKEET